MKPFLLADFDHDDKGSDNWDGSGDNRDQSPIWVVPGGVYRAMWIR